jgi:hypothetical protein
MRVVQFHGAKGGQGTSTTACLFAITHANLGLRVHLLPRRSPERATELAVVCGHSGFTSSEGWANLANGLTWGDEIPESTEMVVTDELLEHEVIGFGHTFETVLVVRNCFLALHACIERPRHYDHIVYIEEPGRALRSTDVVSVLGSTPMTKLEYDPAIARSVDAGLLTTRVPRSARRAFHQFPVATP